MSLQCKTIVLGPAGCPLCVPSAVWDEMLLRRGPLPLRAGTVAQAARAFLAASPGRAPRLAALQCLRVYFDDAGLATTWHLSAVTIAPACPLGPGAAPEPVYDKFSRDPLFWYPDRAELRGMAEALTAAWAQGAAAPPRPRTPAPPLAAPPPAAARTRPVIPPR